MICFQTWSTAVTAQSASDQRAHAIVVCVCIVMIVVFVHAFSMVLQGPGHLTECVRAGRHSRL